jgi:60 kDa SS-A/Ro ribonucleoprotein
LERVIQRPDELTEFLAIYWKDGRQPLSAQVKKGLARAFRKFNEYASPSTTATAR